ncbi:MAG: hypothetical protein ACE5FJ_01140 [Gemmatimonadales bacterium]
MFLYHRTSIALARKIVRDGFEDERWNLGLEDSRTGDDYKPEGIWLTDRPLDRNEGPDGDAVLEVTVSIPEETLLEYELHGVVEGARLWVVPSEIINSKAKVRILEVDPRTSWWYEAPQQTDDEWKP